MFSLSTLSLGPHRSSDLARPCSFQQEIGDVMFLIALEDDVFRLGMGLQRRVKNLLLDQFVGVQLVRDRVKQLIPPLDVSRRCFFDLLQQVLEPPMVAFRATRSAFTRPFPHGARSATTATCSPDDAADGRSGRSQRRFR